MVEIGFSSPFKRAYKKRIKHDPELEVLLWNKVKLFINDPFDRRLKTHKLSGRLEGLWSFSVQYDCRIIFFFEKSDKEVFVDIGSHNEVY